MTNCDYLSWKQPNRWFWKKKTFWPLFFFQQCLKKKTCFFKKKQNTFFFQENTSGQQTISWSAVGSLQISYNNRITNISIGCIAIVNRKHKICKSRNAKVHDTYYIVKENNSMFYIAIYDSEPYGSLRITEWCRYISCSGNQVGTFVELLGVQYVV